MKQLSADELIKEAKKHISTPEDCFRYDAWRKDLEEQVKREGYTNTDRIFIIGRDGSVKGIAPPAENYDRAMRGI